MCLSSGRNGGVWKIGKLLVDWEDSNRHCSGSLPPLLLPTCRYDLLTLSVDSAKTSSIVVEQRLMLEELTRGVKDLSLILGTAMSRPTPDTVDMHTSTSSLPTSSKRALFKDRHDSRRCTNTIVKAMDITSGHNSESTVRSRATCGLGNSSSRVFQMTLPTAADSSVNEDPEFLPELLEHARLINDLVTVARSPRYKLTHSVSHLTRRELSKINFEQWRRPAQQHPNLGFVAKLSNHVDVVG